MRYLNEKGIASFSNGALLDKSSTGTRPLKIGERQSIYHSDLVPIHNSIFLVR